MSRKEELKQTARDLGGSYEMILAADVEGILEGFVVGLRYNDRVTDLGSRNRKALQYARDHYR